MFLHSFNRLVIKFTAIALSIGVLSASLSASASPIKIGVNTWIGYSPLYIAEQLNTFKKYGVEVKLVKFGDLGFIPAALESGAVDGATLTYDQVITDVAKGWKHRAVLPLDYSNGADAILAEKSINSVSDFKGKKVGFNYQTPSDFLLSYALQMNDLTAKDIKSVNLTAELVPSALASGSVPIGVTWEPSVSRVLNSKFGKKFKVVFSSKDAPGLITDVLTFKEDYLSSHPKEVAAIAQAYLDGLAFMKNNPQKAYELVGKWMGLSSKEVEDQLAGVHNPDLNEMISSFTRSDKTTSLYKSGAIISEVLFKAKQIKTRPDTDKTINSDLLKSLQSK